MTASRMQTFLQLLHVSDLHFSDTFYPQKSWTSRVPGLEVHDPQVAVALSRAIHLDQGPTSVAQHLIATGDLTTWGTTHAFQTALTYLRGRIVAGGPQPWIALDAPQASVIPGNHDMWGDTLPTRALVTGAPSAARANFRQFFHEPSPAAISLHADRPFPYQRRLAYGPVAVYLYGIDSTEVHLARYPRWRNVLAEGYVSPQQLRDVEALVHTELHEPRMRLAALHHPLAYSQTNRAPWVGTLLNADSEVLPTLQRLGFSLALCGHQHRGFIRQISAANMTCAPLWVCSVGTATQRVRFSPAQRQLLSKPYKCLNPDEQLAWEAVAQQCNEYRRYDMACDPQDPAQLLVTVHSYRYDPGQVSFVTNPHPLSLPRIDVINS